MDTQQLRMVALETAKALPANASFTTDELALLVSAEMIFQWLEDGALPAPDVAGDAE